MAVLLDVKNYPFDGLDLNPIESNGVFPPEVAVLWKNVEVGIPKFWKRKENTQILKGVSGTVFTNNLTAIIGPSGCGKTTLLNVLTGKMKRNIKGKIKFGFKNEENLKNHVCYIMKECYLLELLSVQETLVAAANLKLPNNITSIQKSLKVKQISESLNLQDSLHKQIKNLSSGEKKRLSLATELISDPLVIFLDEPTSGLDSISSQQLIIMLKNMAINGRAIVCTLHQPSATNLEFFSKLILLGDGYCMYDGRPENILSFTSELGIRCPPYHNPSDFLIEIVMGDYGSWGDKMIAETEKKQIIQDPDLFLDETVEFSDSMSNSITNLISFKTIKSENVYANNSLSQFILLLKRALLVSFRDYSILFLNFISGVLVALILGIVAYQSGNDASKVIYNLGYLCFSMVIVMILIQAEVSIIFPIERNMFIQEHFNKWYTISAYYLAKTISQLPAIANSPCCSIFSDILLDDRSTK